ncbi:MAG TPA: LLM class flavin-dependent oxidoreductase [Novosphingobium sp.]|nr:LLM class flavin-dependent oxidoreductase [Novosphingobium sp.]
MQFGIFDHCERSGRSPATSYQERFALARRAEEAGFHAYHLAEHHGTPLSLVPSPNLFLAALAQHTKTLRLGALVYLLPLYDPYRLAQEICMLDHLSGGRVELGIGRGANPIELGFFGLDPSTAKERFEDLYPLLMQGLMDGEMTRDGPAGVIQAPLDSRPLQRPYPPIWYPSAGGGAQLIWAAQQGFHTILNGPLANCAEASRVFRENFRPGAHEGNPKVGLTRYVYVAETDEEAIRTGEAALAYHRANLLKLTNKAGLTIASPVVPPDNIAQAVREGWAAAGSPATVREQIAAMVDQVDINYFVFAPMMADLSLEWGLRTMDIFREEIIPAFSDKDAIKVPA